MDKRKLSNMLLILTALIWGSAFVAQSIGMEYIGPFTFGAVRSILGGLTLLPVIFFRKKKSQANKGKAEPDEKKEKNEQRKTYSIHFRRKIIDHKNVSRKSERTCQNDPVSL